MVDVLVCLTAMVAAMFACDNYDYTTSPAFTLSFSPREVAWRQQAAFERLKACGAVGAAGAFVLACGLAYEWHRRRVIQ